MRYIEILLERNILNLHEIDYFVDQMANHAQTASVEQWVRTMLPSFLKKKYDQTQKVGPGDLPRYFPGQQVPAWATDGVQKGDLYTVVIADDTRDMVSKTIDYLESEQANHNLSRIPFEVAAKRSQEWHQRLAQQEPAIMGADDEAKLYKAYPGGYKWVLLTTQACLDHEGNVMGHCVGGGTYDASVASGALRIFSFRDAKGESHITAAITPTAVREIKGKQNKSPIPKYVPYVIDLLNALNLPKADEFSSNSDLKNMGIFRGTKGFGPIFDVAQKVEPLKSGHRYVMLDQWEYYITETTGGILVSLKSADAIYRTAGPRAKAIDTIDVKTDVPSKSVRGDILEVLVDKLKNIQLGDNARHTLLTKFAIVQQRGSKGTKGRMLVPMHSVSGMILMASDLLFKVYMTDSEMSAGKNGEIIVLDEGDHPLIYASIQTAGGLIAYMLHQDGWESAIPIFMKVLKKNKLQYNGGTLTLLKLSNWFPVSYYDWKPAAKVISELEPVYEWNGGKWFLIDNHLTLWQDEKIKGALTVRNDNSESEFVVTDVDESYSRGIDFAAAKQVAELFDAGIATIEPQDYRDHPYLIQYDVCHENGNVEAVDWDMPVHVQRDTYNEKNDITKEERYGSTLANVSSELGYDGETWHSNNLAADVILNRGFETEEDHYGNDITQEDLVSHYDDPVAYRKEHGMKPKAKLPMITKTEIMVWK